MVCVLSQFYYQRAKIRDLPQAQGDNLVVIPSWCRLGIGPQHLH